MADELVINISKTNGSGGNSVTNNAFFSQIPEKLIYPANGPTYDEGTVFDGGTCLVNDAVTLYDASKKQQKTGKKPPVPTKKPSYKNGNSIKGTTTQTLNSCLKQKATYEYKFQKSRTDKRVSLNVSPLGNSGSSFVERVKYVLGRDKDTIKKGTTVYGFLYNCLSNSCGLIFPYTPSVSVSHTVNYESTEITHSNLKVLHYKNTPTPTYTIEATFTADNRENAIHMLSALWFLRAVTKCDFGEQANNPNSNDYAGMPPPILYLNGYNQIMDNIPVVVKAFNYTLPKDKDYVSLGINLDTTNFAYNDRKQYTDTNGNFFDNYVGDAQSGNGGNVTYINGLAVALKNLQTGTTLMTSNRYNGYYFNNWLPTELTFSITLEMQPNLLKYKKQFDLNKYKMGLYNLDAYKGGKSVYIPQKNKTISEVTNVDCQNLVTITEYDRDGNKISVKNDNDITTSERRNAINAKTQYINKENITNSNFTYRNINVKKDLNGIDETRLSGTQKTYIFDRSGFTW